MFEKILVCLDGSTLAEQIIPCATEVALRFQSTLVLLHAVPQPVMNMPGLPGAPGVPIETTGMVERMQLQQNEAQSYLEHLAHQLRDKNLTVETVLLHGNPAKIILPYAAENDISLIALATHGRGGLGRAVFGSVADEILRNSRVPILIIRPTNI